MTQSYKNKFIIDHIDPLGQGVFKENSDIFFIPKTLPGETGSFHVIKSSKGVHFGELDNIEIKSDLRISPKCPHFKSCNGCAYLHTSVATEHKIKLSHLERMLEKSLNYTGDIETITDSKRFSYRNRIQLHYHQSSKSLGFMARKSKKIIPISNCLLADLKIQNKLSELTSNNKWISLIPKDEPKHGHIEIALVDGEVTINWNKDYAWGGFSQVNSEVNTLFLNEVEKLFNDQKSSILDLFGGSGNLVNKLSSAKSLSIDIYPNGAERPNQFSLDLFKDSALERFREKFPLNFNTLFIDPPRSGFTYLDKWTQALGPEKILYVSCHPATMVRDIQKISSLYKIEKSYFLDFFPGTHHFESAIFLTRKE